MEHSRYKVEVVIILVSFTKYDGGDRRIPQLVKYVQISQKQEEIEILGESGVGVMDSVKSRERMSGLI